MVEVKRIIAPSDIPAEGSYVLVLYGPSVMDREHPRGRMRIPTKSPGYNGMMSPGIPE
jgi:hypothetical protein